MYVHEAALSLKCVHAVNEPFMPLQVCQCATFYVQPHPSLGKAKNQVRQFAHPVRRTWVRRTRVGATMFAPSRWKVKQYFGGARQIRGAFGARVYWRRERGGRTERIARERRAWCVERRTERIGAWCVGMCAERYELGSKYVILGVAALSAVSVGLLCNRIACFCYPHVCFHRPHQLACSQGTHEKA